MHPQTVGIGIPFQEDIERMRTTSPTITAARQLVARISTISIDVRSAPISGISHEPKRQGMHEALLLRGYAWSAHDRDQSNIN
jgi:hypothetical protein